MLERITMWCSGCGEQKFFDRSIERISRAVITDGYIKRTIEYRCSDVNCYGLIKVKLSDVGCYINPCKRLIKER